MKIIYRDESLVAVNKPSGLLVHRSPIDRHETRFALQEVRDLLGRRVFPVHRLDKPTSGVLVFALSAAAARHLADSFEAGRVAKRYLAVVRGVVGEEGVIDHPLVEEPDRMEKGTVLSAPPPRSAVTGYQRLAEVEISFAVGRYASSRYSLVLALPQTGRRHQIRRHLKHFFHPIIGDTKYGEGRHNRFFREELDCHRLLLHAVELTLPHPVTGLPLTITAPLDGSFDALMERFGWRHAVPENWLPAPGGTTPGFCATIETTERHSGNGGTLMEAVKSLEKAAFGAGCFWHVEETFRRVSGVVATQVGYMGGWKENPTYEEVCSKTTGHAEVVEVTYDPAQVSYDELLRVFWDVHDPTQLNRQGPDIGTNYRSAIFFHTADQEAAARISLEREQRSGRYSRPIVTEITAAATFWRAEEYHQLYLEKRGGGSCNW